MEESLRRIQHQLNALHIDISNAINVQNNHAKTVNAINKLGTNNIVLKSHLGDSTDSLKGELNDLNVTMKDWVEQYVKAELNELTAAIKNYVTEQLKEYRKLDDLDWKNGYDSLVLRDYVHVNFVHK